MDLLLQFLRDDDKAVGSERNIIKGTLEKMMLDVARQLMPVIMEPMIRRVVKEELVKAMEKVLPTMKMNSESRASISESPSLQLQFLSRISPVVWTGKKNEEENPHIEVALIDVRTGEVVKSGPEAEAKVEIVALKGDSDGIGEGDSLTSEEFNDKIIRECKGKKSILRGKTYLKLKEGKAFSSDISFTHSKDWMNIHELRLGAKIVDSVFTTTIKEAKTESFILKDLRNKNKKHYPPLPSDEVWRIEKIQKKGSYHKRLLKANINTVKDFLTLLSINPKELQNILEICATPKIWKAMVDHAQTCLDNEGLYKYNDPSYEQNTEVVFNADGRLMGLNIESQYVPFDQLSEDKKANGQKSVKSASEHWQDVVSLKDEASLRNASIQSAMTAKSFSSLTGEGSAGSNYRIPPLASDQGSPSGSNCRIPPLDSDQESRNSRNPPLFSNQGSPTGYNCINPSLVSDPECPAGTPPLTDDHSQPSSSSLVITQSFDPSRSANNFHSWPSFDEHIESHNFTYQSHDLPIPSPENYEELWHSWYSDHNLQQENPNVEMNPEQQGSACDILMTSQEVCMDQNQNIICKMVRSLSIRIGATEPEGIHVEKKQRGC